MTQKTTHEGLIRSKVALGRAPFLIPRRLVRGGFLVVALIALATRFPSESAAREVALALSEAEQIEQRAFQAALMTLEHYLRAGSTEDASQGARLTTSYYVEPRRSTYDTRLLYRKHERLLASYVSVSSDVYGYEFGSNRSTPTLEFQGGIETTSGIVAEYAVSMVYRKNRWLIGNLSID